MRFSLVVSAALAIGGIAQETYTNPILWNDLADLDVFRVNDTYYYSASTMAFSPGAPILTSKDLVNWQFVGHSVPRLDFGNATAYNLEEGQQAYVRGIWASSMRYRESDGLFYWIGCVDFEHTYIYTASDPTGDWSLASTIGTCYYDCGLLFDGDDSIYVAYGNTNITVAQLNDDLTEKSVTSVFNGTFYIEGSRFYNINGTYYIMVTQPATREWTLKSTGDMFGPYEIKIFADEPTSPVPEWGGHPHQGGIVDTPNGDWYYLAFDDDYPGGRLPMLAPFSFDEDGWPTLPPLDVFTQELPYPSTPVPVDSVHGLDTFPGPKLDPQWEWNRKLKLSNAMSFVWTDGLNLDNPVESAYSVAEGGGLILSTATVTEDIYHAQNTLTHRILGPKSQATIELDLTSMAAGDRAGLSLFRDHLAYLSYEDGNLSLWRNASLDIENDWNTKSIGQIEESVDLLNLDCIWMRLQANIDPGSDNLGTFYYSTNGDSFVQIGTPYLMNDTYNFFIGYRYGIFNFATEELGGSVMVKSFEQELVE